MSKARLRALTVARLHPDYVLEAVAERYACSGRSAQAVVVAIHDQITEAASHYQLENHGQDVAGAYMAAMTQLAQYLGLRGPPEFALRHWDYVRYEQRPQAEIHAALLKAASYEHLTLSQRLRWWFTGATA